MLKPIMSLAVLGLCTGVVKAQDTLQVQGTSPNLYISHVVKKGENFYSLGRAYGLSPKVIAAANNLSLDKGLQLGHSVHIPLDNANFSQKAEANSAGYNKPVYHKVSEKETLYRVSVNHNKVALDNIRRWNGFSGDGLKKDSYLIVGWMKGNGAAAPVIAKNETPAPVVTSTPASTPATAPVREVPAAQPAAETKEPKDPVKKENPAPAENTVTHTPAPSTPAPVNTSGNFEEIYEQQTKGGKKVTSEKGPGTWFKSNAVGKFYALHNTAARGTILKVTNPLNGKAIYAKVLDVIPQMKSNAGLIVKLSDSAMQALGSNETRFYCELSYED